MRNGSSLGLYLHIPFCSSICHYCSFNRGLFDGALKRRYLAALEREIRRGGPLWPPLEGGHGGPPLQADTMYFGGGTPSLLEPAEVARLIRACHETFETMSGAEITLEINPDDASAERLEGYRRAGANRVSFGVQSFRDAELEFLGRRHDADCAHRAYRLARAAGFDNVSVDLMMWLPDQRVAQWMESIDSLIALGPEHASLYMLELYPNAPLREEMARANRAQAPDEEAGEMYLRAFAALDAAGYEQYEISNVARPGKRSRHNLKYWSDGDWLGFGCGAHSTRGLVRWKNVAGTEEYIARVSDGRSAVAERRVMTSGERLEDALITGLRLTDGVDATAMGARYGCAFWARYGERLSPYLDAGLVVRDGDRLQLTRQGMLLSNEVLGVFV